MAHLFVSRVTKLTSRACYPKVRVPTLVLHARHDNVVPLEQGRLLAASIPNARLVTLESDNHVLLGRRAGLGKIS